MSEDKDVLEFGIPMDRIPGRLRPLDLLLISDLIQELEAFFGERLQSVKLVGSRARGTAKPSSDFDFLVFLDVCDYEIELPKFQLLSEKLDSRHNLGPLSISPLSREQFLGLDAKFEGITDNFRRDALNLWPDGRACSR